MLSHFSHVQLSATPWTMASQAPLSMGFSRQEYWSGLPFPSPVIKYEMSEVGEVKSLSHVRLFVAPWTAAYQAPPSMGFSRQRVLEWGAIAFSVGSPGLWQFLQLPLCSVTESFECPGILQNVPQF